MSDPVRLETGEAPGVATIRLDRPKVNAFDSAMTECLAEVVEAVAADDSVRAVVIWGGPRVFAAGVDVNDFVPFGRAEAEAFSRRFNAVLSAVEHLPQITIAAVNRYALGGGFELALAAEFRVAGDDAVFGLPEIQLGLLPGGGGTQRLPRAIGITRAKELVYTGRHVDADEAHRLGLVSAVHPAEEAYPAALEMAARFAAGPASLRLAKRAINEGFDRPLPEALEAEIAAFADAFTTEDRHIGLRSFLEHGPGKATFTGR